MNKKQLIGLLIIAVLAVSAGVIKGTFFNKQQVLDPSDFDRPLTVTKNIVDWETKPQESEILDYTLGVSDMILKTNNTLDFSIWFKKAPVILESVLGSQLGRQVFQITNQTFLIPDTIKISELDMSKFNPFEPIVFTFIYEYDSGVRARHKIELELK